MMRVISVFMAGACATLAACSSGSTHEAPDAAIGVPTSLELRGWAEPVIVEERAFGIGSTATGALPEARIGWGRALGTTAVTSAPVRDGGGVVRDVGWALARLDGTADHIEQSWVVARHPATPALDIRVDIEGGVFLGSGSDGLVFRTVDESYLLYGHGVWVDADGRRTRIPARHVEGGVALLVPQALLDRSSYPAILDPILATAQTLQPSQLTSPRIDQRNPSIAFGGGAHLVVWSDQRIDTAPGVYGTFRDGFGPVGERQGFLIGRGELPRIAARPYVVYAGGVFLVVWASFDTVYAVRVDATTGVLDDPPIEVAVGGDPSGVRVATQGSDFVLTWQDDGTRPGLRSARVDTTGAVVSAPSYLWEQDVSFHGASLRAAPGGGYWLVYADNADGDYDLRLLRLDATGAASDSSPQTLLATFADQTYPDLAFDGLGAAMVAYQDTSTLAIHALTVSEAAGGALVLGAPTRISVGSREFGVSVVHDGSQFRVGYISSAPGDPTPQVARMAGPTRVTPATAGSGSASGLQLAMEGTLVHVVWSAFNDATRGRDIFRSWANTFGSSFAPPVLSSSAPFDQLEAHIGNNIDRSLVAWVRPGVGGDQVYAARVNALGEFEDLTPIVLSLERLDIHVDGVYSDGNDFLVVWSEKTSHRVGIYTVNDWNRMIARVADDGTLSSVHECGPTSSSTPSPIAVRKSGFLTYTASYIDGDVIYDRRVGSLSCTGGRGFLAEDASIVDALELATTNRAVYYIDQTGHLFRVPQSGGIEGSTPVAVVGAPTGLEHIDVLSVGGGEVIAYAENVSRLPTRQTVGAFFVDATGTVTWSRTLRSVNAVANTQIARSDSGYFVLWTGTGGSINGQRLSSTGELVDLVPVVIAGRSRLQKLGDAVTDPLGRCTVAYRSASSATGYALRLHIVAIDFRFNAGAAPGATCTTGFDCASGYCVDAVCCGSPCGYSNQGDCQACSVAAGAATDGACSVVPTGTECRPVAGECDFAEVCDGTSIECPGDVVEAADSACGEASTGPCDLADHCDGISGVCRAGGVAAAGTACRESRGGCDVADVCDGLSAACADGVAMAGVTCRRVAGRCDILEICDGVTDTCPADVVAPSGVICRRSRGTCDVVDVCDGATPVCPRDELVGAGVVCHPSAGVCDPEETCTGSSTRCPDDQLASASTVCRAAAGACDVEETCDGADADCPADALAGRGVLCRAGTGPCDAMEYCAGDVECPGDVSLPNGSLCGATSPEASEVCMDGTCVEIVRPVPKGCGCAVQGGSSHAPAWALGAFAWLAWRRRRRASA